MFASAVLNVSTFWPADDAHEGEQLCWANASYTDRRPSGCGYPKWHPYQILGPPADVLLYGDSSRAAAFSTMSGAAGFAEGGDEYLKFAHDPGLSLERFGYSEFIEVSFEQDSHIQAIEILVMAY